MELFEQGLFRHSPAIDADGSLSLLRYARSSVGRLLHILPAALWSFIAPFQVSQTFRSRYPAVHRALGRIFIGLSICNAIGAPALMINKATKTEYGIIEGSGMFAMSTYFLCTALLAIYHARGKRFARHRVWVLRHVATGYGVHLERLMMQQTLHIVGPLVPKYYDHTEEGSRIRDVVFSTYFWGSMVLSLSSMELWLRYTRKGQGSGAAVVHTKQKVP